MGWAQRYNRDVIKILRYFEARPIEEITAADVAKALAMRPDKVQRICGRLIKNGNLAEGKRGNAGTPAEE